VIQFGLWQKLLFKKTNLLKSWHLMQKKTDLKSPEASLEYPLHLQLLMALEVL
jgi:hypothetical protein